MSALVPQHFTVCNTLGPECRLNARSLVLLYLLHHPLGYRPRERRLWQGECLRPTPRGPGEKRRRVATSRWQADGRRDNRHLEMQMEEFDSAVRICGTAAGATA